MVDDNPPESEAFLRELIESSPNRAIPEVARAILHG
jgi:hypothetical protein